MPNSNYSDFNDPVGLAFRMLRRPTRESVWLLMQMACEVAAKPVHRIAARGERFEERDVDIPQILIVGLPRTGTTIVSQVLTRQLDVSYFPNVSAIFPSAPIWASKRIAGNFKSAPTTTKNFYGSTVGLRGISDGFHIWNRWFGSHRYCVDRTPNDDEVVQLQEFFATWSGVFQKPLLNKNNRNVDAIARLAEYLPNAVFVVVERDDAMTVQSLLQARRFVQGTDSTGWGLYSNRFHKKEADPITSVSKQVVFASRRMEEQLSHVSQKRLVRLRYEEFCDSPMSAVERVLESVDGLTTRPKIRRSVLPALTANSKVSVSAEQWRRIQHELAEARESAETSITSRSRCNESVS